jgi:hypothetical protein
VVEHLYRTPRGLMCGRCVRTMDSSGLGFGRLPRRDDNGRHTNAARQA